MSASERWRRKKDGEGDCTEGNRQQVTELTELANRLLTKTGNMDIYQEGYEHIAKLVSIVSALPKVGVGRRGLLFGLCGILRGPFFTSLCLSLLFCVTRTKLLCLELRGCMLTKVYPEVPRLSQ